MVGNTFLMVVVRMLAASDSSRLIRISPTPKSPMATVTKSMLLCRSGIPKANRTAPESGSRPTDPMSRPRMAMVSPFSGEAPAR